MRTALDHLDTAKRQEIARVVNILLEEFRLSITGRNAPGVRSGRVLKMILFGSYARGDWVSDPVGGYFSDLDLLALVNNEEVTDIAEFWRSGEDRLLRELQAGAGVRTAVNLIVHTVADFNRRLRKGRPFFISIYDEGILLHDAGGQPFERPTPLSREAALEESRRYFEDWFGSAGKFLAAAEYLAGLNAPRECAFQLHQATERLYHCVLLVLTLHGMKSHKLNFLRSRAEDLAPGLMPAWPRNDRFAQRCFELLRRAYVDARYSPEYRISTEEIEWLIARVKALASLVEEVCLRHLENGPAS